MFVFRYTRGLFLSIYLSIYRIYIAVVQIWVEALTITGLIQLLHLISIGPFVSNDRRTMSLLPEPFFLSAAVALFLACLQSLYHSSSGSLSPHCTVMRRSVTDWPSMSDKPAIRRSTDDRPTCRGSSTFDHRTCHLSPPK